MIDPNELEIGLRLPNRGTLIRWGQTYESLKDSADDSRDWLPYGHKIRYGELHWKNEILIPHDKTKVEMVGGVMASVCGSPMTIRRFSLYGGKKGNKDYGDHFENIRYSRWMAALTKMLGAPSLRDDDLSSGRYLSPTLVWHAGLAKIELIHCISRSEETFSVSVSHKNYEL